MFTSKTNLAISLQKLTRSSSRAFLKDAILDQGAGESLCPVYLFLRLSSYAKNSVLTPGLYMP